MIKNKRFEFWREKIAWVFLFVAKSWGLVNPQSYLNIKNTVAVIVLIKDVSTSKSMIKVSSHYAICKLNSTNFEYSPNLGFRLPYPRWATRLEIHKSVGKTAISFECNHDSQGPHWESQAFVRFRNTQQANLYIW